MNDNTTASAIWTVVMAALFLAGLAVVAWPRPPEPVEPVAEEPVRRGVVWFGEE